MADSASAEAIADVVLCPFEAVIVPAQEQPGFAKGLADGFRSLYRTEAITGENKMMQQLAISLNEQMTQQVVTLHDQMTHQLIALQQQMTITQQLPPLQEEMAQQFATVLKKLLARQLAILENLKTSDQTKCLKMKRSRETMESHMIEPYHTQCSKIVKRSSDNNLFFPEELVEKILARMPLPSLFKIRVLSKSWSAKLPLCDNPSSSLNAFQKEVNLVSNNWLTYSPVFLTKDGFWGFERVSYQWKSLFKLSHLPIIEMSQHTSITSLGPLMLVIPPLFNEIVLWVTNIFTRSWKELTIPSTLHKRVPGEPSMFAKLLPGDSDTYRVLLVYRVRKNHATRWKTILYDSSVRGWPWSVKYSRDLGIVYCSSPSVYFRGKVYCIISGRSETTPRWELCIYHVDSDQTWMHIPLNIPSRSWGTSTITAGVVLCGEKIMVVTWGWRNVVFELDKSSGNYNKGRPYIQIYQLDLDSLQLVKECKGPPKTMLAMGLYKEFVGMVLYNKHVRNTSARQQIRFASDDDSIYFAQAIYKNLVLRYNVHTREWDCLPPACGTFGFQDGDRNAIILESSFAPGINPFADV